MVAADRAWQSPHATPRERQLWAAVLMLAMDDMIKGDLSPDYIGGRDFVEVAELAGLDPDAARDGITKRLQAGAVA